jgi:D-alanyl-lipoteichoic acid acyltransferase DltB (MBOAT superfamily)
LIMKVFGWFFTFFGVIFSYCSFKRLSCSSHSKCIIQEQHI